MDKRKKTDGTKNLVTASLPSANSEEFVPIPMENLQEAPPPASDDVYDFIPNLRSDKYK